MCFNEQPIETTVDMNDEIESESEFEHEDDSNDELVQMENSRKILNK